MNDISETQIAIKEIALWADPLAKGQLWWLYDLDPRGKSVVPARAPPPPPGPHFRGQGL